MMEKKRSKFIHILSLIAIPIVGLVAVFMMITAVRGLQISLFANDNYLAHSMNQGEYYFIYFFQLELTACLLTLAISRYNQGDLMRKITRKPYFKKVCLGALLINVLVLTVTIFSSTFVYEDHFIVRDLSNLGGRTYSLSDVERIDTGYSTARKDKGYFYYDLTMKDGFTVAVNACYPSDAYMGDNMYRWLQDLDQRIMTLSPEKTVDFESEKDSYTYAEKYKQVFRTIMMNK
jgi:hypothetical protein